MEIQLTRMKKSIRIIEKTPLGYIVELLDTGTRLMLPKLMLRQKIKRGVYIIEQPVRSRDI